MHRGIFSIFIQFGYSQQTLIPSQPFPPKMIKKQEKTRHKQTLDSESFSAKFGIMYIALLQFYKQMYNKYIIINRLVIVRQWGASLRGGVLSSFSRVPVRRSMSRDFPLRGVFVLLCTAATKIHPPQVVSVCYPVVGTQSAAFAVCCGVSAHRTWEEK